MNRLRRVLTVLAIASVTGSRAYAAESADPLVRIAATIPQRAEDFRLDDARKLAPIVTDAEDWAANLIWQRGLEDADAVHASIAQLVKAKQHVDGHLEQTVAMRSRFAEFSNDSRRQDLLRAYLLTTSHLIDLSGRLRYVLRDAVNNASYALGSDLEQLTELVDLLTREKVSIGAPVMAFVLFDPPEGIDAQPYPDALKHKVLELIGVGGSAEVLADLAEFVRQKSASAEMTLRAAEIIRRIGLPQQPRGKQDPQLPPPPITAQELRGYVASRPTASSAPELRKRRDDLLAWLTERSQQGVSGDTIRVDGFDVRVGDWLLMRNPSPYNLFTDLAPGLFTHVGVVATETGSDGVRRFVIVDLPERGERIPATNVDTYLLRTVHYAFLRHHDARTAQTMGQVAGSLIGYESQFDLTFRSGRVRDLQGRLHKGTIVNTYCTGFLLLCAQEAGASREELFPIVERAAGGECAANLAKMGLSIGDDFISPTGAMFSPHLACVARREAMYTPDRAIKESIYDHFAHGMITQELQPSPDLYQALRQTAASLANGHPWLARALARANNVSEHVDLESAAKAAAVIESLDEIADKNMHEFVAAWHALMSGPLEQLGEIDEATRNQISTYRQRHADLYEPWSQRLLSARELRVALVEYYQNRGHSQVGQRFFGT